LHPLHVDPEIAAAAGFERPILHGLCTLGSLTLAIARALDRDPGDLSAASARLTAPVYPGQELAVELWRGGAAEETGFAASTDDTDVVRGGVAVFSEAPP
jgi:acyl dehydratase